MRARADERGQLAGGASSAARERGRQRVRRAKPRRAAAVRGMGHAVSRRGCGQRGGAGPMTCARELGFRAGRSREGGGNGGEAGPAKREKEEWAEGENVGPQAKMREDFFLLFLNHFLFLVSNPKPNSNQFQV